MFSSCFANYYSESGIYPIELKSLLRKLVLFNVFFDNPKNSKCFSSSTKFAITSDISIVKSLPERSRLFKVISGVDLILLISYLQTSFPMWSSLKIRCCIIGLIVDRNTSFLISTSSKGFHSKKRVVIESDLNK